MTEIKERPLFCILPQAWYLELCKVVCEAVGTLVQKHVEEGLEK